MMKSQKGYVVVQSGCGDLTNEGSLAALKRHVLRWWTLHRERQLLAGLSDDALKDMGLSRADIQQEVDKPFWDDPMKR